jgi:HEAT repeat protein
MEVRRSQVYDELRELGDALVASIVRGLADPNVQVRRNVALFLRATADTWNDWHSARPRLDLRPHLTALTEALGDSDSRVRQLSAGALGIIGPDASSGVPALIALLAYTDEGSRGGACSGLGGIGPPARAAVPALRQLLSDPDAAIRFCAARAISRIEEP